jgi:hypothetical protein
VISEQRERWLADGSPPVPTLVVGGVPHVLQHPSQAAMLLGFEPPPALRDARGVAWDVDSVMRAWVELCERTPWNALAEPIPGFGRTPLALAVDASVGIRAVQGAFASGWFHWPGDPVSGELGDAAVVAYEASIVATIGGREALLAFVGRTAREWRRFVGDSERAFEDDPARPVGAPRGQLTWVELLEAQRLHALQHYRQASTRVAELGHPVPELDLDAMVGLRLPREIYR